MRPLPPTPPSFVSKVEAMVEERLKEKRLEKERIEWVRGLREEANRPRLIAKIPVNLGGPDDINITIYEGEDIEQKLFDFAVQHSMTQDGLQLLKQSVLTAP